MNLSALTQPGLAETALPVSTTQDGLPVVRLVPRHLSEESATKALEWVEYDTDENRRLAERGGPTGAAIERERVNRWEDFVDAVAPTFTTRAEALSFMAYLRVAINDAFPVAPSTLGVPRSTWPCVNCGTANLRCQESVRCCGKCQHTAPVTQ